MEIKVIRNAEDRINLINACTDTCVRIVSAPLGDTNWIEILKKIDDLDGENVVIGIENGQFEIHENTKQRRIELWITEGDIKLCKVVF